MNLSARLDGLNKKLYFQMLALSTVVYYALARVGQDYFYQDRFTDYISGFFSGFLPKPEPLEVPLYFLGYLVIPAAALGLYWLQKKKVLKYLVAVGVLMAGVFAIPRLPGLSLPDLSVYTGYLESKGLGKAAWLVLTKRTFVLSVITGASLIFFGLSFYFWQPRFSELFKRHANPEILRKLTPFLIILVGLLIWSPNLPYEEHHYNFVIGTVNDVLAGKSFLNETSNQYGILNIYFLQAIFSRLDLSYEAFSFVLFLFYYAFYIGLFYLIRLWLKSDLFAYIGIGVILAVTYFLQVSPTLSALFYPSLTPFRYGFYLLPLFLILAYARRRSALLRELIIVLSAVGIFWNFDFGVYSALAAYLVLLYAEPRKFFWLTLRFALYSAAVLAAVSGLNKILFGVYPQWQQSLTQTVSYTQGVARNPLPLFGFFEVYIFVYLSSALYLIYQSRKGRPVDLPLLFLVVFGIFSLNYYIGNSAWNLLYHIAVPFILIVLYFSKQYIDKRLAFSALTTVMFFSLLVLAVKLPVEFGNRDYSRVGKYAAAEAYNEPVEKDGQLIREKYGFLDRVPLLHQRSARILITAGKTNYFDYYDLAQLNNKNNIGIIIDKVHAEKPEFLFVEKDRNDQIEYIMERIGAGYKKADSLNTIDVYQRADK